MLTINQSPEAKSKLESYPKEVKPKLLALRTLIIESAKELNISTIEECLKWGEPSYIVKKGSTIRMDWKSKAPEQYALYFNCNTSLVETFKTVYGDLFQYEKNRAILFKLESSLPKKEVKECIQMALQYHLLKNKPFLGK